MPVVRAKLADKGRGCTKPNCGHRAALNRHHKAHEALWFGFWAHRAGESKWKEFVRRYYEFREEDICRVCLPHHAEIHNVYDEIIADDIARTGLPLHLYSWKQGRILMERLRNACNVWLQQETPGLDPDVYEKTKKARRVRLRKQARRLHPQKPGQKKVLERRLKKVKRAKKRTRRYRRGRDKT